MRLLTVFILLLGLSSCQTTAVNNELSLSFTLSGEMLFSGANTLQAPMQADASSLARQLNLEAEHLKSVSVSRATITMSAENAAITESLLLQVVSNNNDLTTLGTLSPLPEGTEFELQLAEEIDLLPYLQDAGGTWVLDANLAEDHLDVLEVPAALNLEITYSES